MTRKWFDLSMGEANRVKKPLRTGKEDLFRTDSFDLDRGRRIDNWNPESCLWSTSGEDDGDPDDILCVHLQVPTFSKRLRKALERAAVATKDIQYLPVRVFKSNGDEIGGFAFANVVSRVAALDYDRSIGLECDEKEIDPQTSKLKVLSMWKAALLDAPLANYDVIRLLEFFPAVCVSERFSEVFRRGGFTGATLQPVLVT